MLDDTLFWSKARASGCAYLVCAATISLMLVSCVDGGPATSAGTGALSASGDSSLRTYTPEEWTARCAAHLGTTRLCRALSSARGANDRERAALDLNVANASGLAAQHFVHGARIAISVSDLVTLARPASAPPIVTTAVYDANRAYAGGIDHAVLADWITTPVCGLPASSAVQGPVSARCVALDSDCRRGRFDATRACCTEWDMPAGMVCGEDDATGDGDGDGDEHHGDDDHGHGDDDRGHGDDDHGGHGHDDDHGRHGHDDDDHGAHHVGQPSMCSGRGVCVAASEVPPLGRVSGVASWVEPVRLDANPPPAPDLWYLQPESSQSAIEIRLDGAPAAIVPSTQEGHRTRVGMSVAGTLGVTTLDLGSMTPDSVVRSIFLPRRISLNTDLANGETYEVCAAHGSFDLMPTLVGECQGDQRVTCPSAPGAAIGCTIDARGFSVLTAPGLSIAWERDPVPGPCAAPACLFVDPDGGTECVIWGPGSQVCLFAWPDGGVTCDLCPGGSDAGPPDAGSRDAGTDASLPRFSDIRDPAIVGLVALMRPPSLSLAPIHVLCTGSSCPGGPVCGRPRPCELDCEAPGTSYCVSGVYGACRAPLLESCNGLDDDCDGRVDEFASWQCDDRLPCTEDVCTAHITGTADPCRHYAGTTGAGGARFPGPPSTGPGTAPATGAAWCTHAPAMSCDASGCTPIAPVACELARCAPRDLDPDPTVLLAPGTADTPLGAVAAGDRTTPSPAALDRNGCVYVERDQTYCIANSALGNTPPQGGNSSSWPIARGWQLCAGPRPICVPGAAGADSTTGCIDRCARPTVTPGATTQTTSGGGGEGSIVFSPPGPGDPTGAISLIDAQFQGFHWTAVSPASLASFATAPDCQATGTCTLACLPTAPTCTPTGPVPTPDGATARWTGDPVSASDGAGNVVYAGLYAGLGHIVVAISTDGGRSFVNSQIADSTTGCVNSVTVSDNRVDQPSIAIDSAFSPPHVWVAWRHQDFPGGSEGGCIRGGTLIASPPGGALPFVRWDLGARVSHGIDLQRETDDEFGGAEGQGGLRVIARRLANGTERVSVAYERNGSQIYGDCTTNHAQSWDMVSSEDGGISWPIQGQIHHVDYGSYRWCAVPDFVTPHIARGLHDFDLVDDPVGGARWVVVAFNTTLQVYFTVNDVDWNLAHEVVNHDESYIWLPAIAADDGGRIAATYYSWQPPGIARWFTASSADWFSLNTSSLDASWSAPIRISTNPTTHTTGFFPVIQAAGREPGDYMTMTAVPSGALPARATFVGAWVEVLRDTAASATMGVAPVTVIP